MEDRQKKNSEIRSVFRFPNISIIFPEKGLTIMAESIKMVNANPACP